MSKPHKDMTLDELKEEFIEYWGDEAYSLIDFEIDLNTLVKEAFDRGFEEAKKRMYWNEFEENT